MDWQGEPPSADEYPGDYCIIATDVVTAERVTEPLQAEAGVPGELQGFTTVLQSNPRGSERARYIGRDPTLLRGVGAKAWDRLRANIELTLELGAELLHLVGHLANVQSRWALERTCSALPSRNG